MRLPAAIRGMLTQHDLLVSIGADLFTLSLPGEIESMPEDYPVVHLDTDPWELAKNYPEKVSILGEPKVTLAGTDRSGAEGSLRRLRRKAR